MNARLFCKTGQLAGAEYEIGDDATIGKSTGNTIQLYPTIISGNHARIAYDGKKSCYILEDLKSRNGTRLDGVRVTGRERLDDLNVITFADKFDFIFQVLDAKESKPKPKAPASPAQLPTPIRQTPQIPKQTVLSDDFAPVPTMQAKQEPAGRPTPEPVKQAKPIQAKTMIDDGFSPALPPIDDKRAEQKPPPQDDKKVGQKPPAPPPSTDKNKTVFGDDFVPMPAIPGASRDRGEALVSGRGMDPKPPVRPPGIPVAGSEAVPASGPKAAPETARTFVLEFKSIKTGPSSFTLREGENIIGRETGCEITIEDGSLSRRHAMLTMRDGKVKLKDLGSKNHTFAGGTKITSEIEIQPGMVIMFGVVTATLRKQ